MMPLKVAISGFFCYIGLENRELCGRPHGDLISSLQENWEWDLASRIRWTVFRSFL